VEQAEDASAQAAAAAAAARRDVSPDTVASIILGGGAGTRLFPLTQTRAKPAVTTLARPLPVPRSRAIATQLFSVHDS